jgi:hypothetical protein
VQGHQGWRAWDDPTIGFDGGDQTSVWATELRAARFATLQHDIRGALTNAVMAESNEAHSSALSHLHHTIKDSTNGR